MFSTADLIVLAVLILPLLVFLGALFVLLEWYDSDPPSEILKRWRRERAIRAPLEAYNWTDIH